MTIEEIKNDKKQLEDAVRKLVLAFEEKHSKNGVYLNNMTASFEFSGGIGGMPLDKYLDVKAKIDFPF